jgi:predicted RNA binding protein YcfA (HicA-like mRNA interferase family)
MKKGIAMIRFLITGLLLSIGIVMFAGGAHAQATSRYCYYHPDDPDCDGPVYDGSNQDDDPNYGDDGYDQPLYQPPPRPRYARPVLAPCDQVARNLTRQGFVQVRAIECNGSSFKYRAVQNGQRVVVKVRSNGQILRVKAY